MTHIRESDVQEWLAFLLKGRREQVLVDLGRLDIIVPGDGVEYVIEVKKGSKFLHAIGQVIGYTTFLEKDRKNIERIRVVALFDWRSMSPERIQQCYNVCEKVNIQCWLIDEHFLKFMYLLERSNVEKGTDIRPQHYFMEQYLSERIKEQRRLEFHNSMKRGEIKPFIHDDDTDDEVDHIVDSLENMHVSDKMDV